MTKGFEKLPLVSIYFAEAEINLLFSELLRAKGLRTRILSSVSEADGHTKIITEPQYFPDLPEIYQGTCLVVGNKDSLKGINGVHLSRPLTEAKIEQALAEFLDS